MKLTWKNKAKDRNNTNKKRRLGATSEYPGLPFDSQNDPLEPDTTLPSQNQETRHHDDHSLNTDPTGVGLGASGDDLSDSSNAKRLADSFRALGTKLAEVTILASSTKLGF